MVRKKLLTLAGVVGILACGACFLPPLPQHRPAPPPIGNGLDGVQNIRVEVANSSPSHHLNSADLARKIADAINEQSWKMKVSAHVGKEAGVEDAVLAITVSSETVVSALAAESRRMTFLIKDSATLTRLDGSLVWQETDAEYWITRNVAEVNQADVWKEPGLVDGVNKTLSDRLALRMFYGR